MNARADYTVRGVRVSVVGGRVRSSDARLAAVVARALRAFPPRPERPHPAHQFLATLQVVFGRHHVSLDRVNGRRPDPEGEHWMTAHLDQPPAPQLDTSQPIWLGVPQEPFMTRARVVRQQGARVSLAIRLSQPPQVGGTVVLDGQHLATVTGGSRHRLQAQLTGQRVRAERPQAPADPHRNDARRVAQAHLMQRAKQQAPTTPPPRRPVKSLAEERADGEALASAYRQRHAKPATPQPEAATEPA